MGRADTNLPFWLAVLSLQEQAVRDGLTGLYNRRYFDETLADHVQTARRYGRELSLVLLDLDRFKRVNDTLGHAAGDAVLKAFADGLRVHARQADILCRIGGDEFAVILPETGRTGAGRFAARIAEIAQHPAAAGIAALPCEDLFAAADAALLAEKKAGPASRS
jgi:two-component system cell cycle response regulator